MVERKRVILTRDFAVVLVQTTWRFGALAIATVAVSVLLP